MNVNGGSLAGANALLKVDGTSIANPGTISLTASTGNARLEIGASTALTGAGVVTMSNNAHNYIEGVTATDVLTSSSTIEDSGNIGAGRMGLVNQGNILANQSTPLIIDPSSTGFNNKGILTVNAGSQYDQLRVSGAATLKGTLNLSLIDHFVPTVGTPLTS